MSNENVEADENLEATSNSEGEVKRPRGRPKGVKVGPRPVTWACAAVVNDVLVHIRMAASATANEQERGAFSAEAAKAQFIETYGVEPEVLGPFYDQKGGQINTSDAAKKRETVSMSVEDIKLTQVRENAIFRGWEGVAYGIEGREDVVYFMPGREIIPSPDKKKAPPAAKPILRSALQFQNN